MTNSLGKSCKDYSFWQPCWWSAIFLPLHLFGESIHNSQALPSIPGDNTLSACYFKTRWCWESLRKLSSATLFFGLVPHYPYGPASCKMDGTAWQYLSIKKDSPCVTIFLVYEMSSVQQSFSGDAENDKARFLAICCSFSKPCCLPLPDFANLRELFLALARLCCLSRLLLAISPPFQVVWQWEGHLGGTWVLQRVFRMFSNSFLEIVDFSSFHKRELW